MEITPAKTIASVTILGEAPSTTPRTAAESTPDFSATPIPSIATNTTPSGAKPVKLVTSPVKMRRIPSASIRLTARIIPSSARPEAPAGRGSTTARSIQANRPESSTMPKARSANSVTGCGNRLPSHSTPSRKRVKELRRAGRSAGSVGSTGGRSAGGGNSVTFAA